MADPYTTPDPNNEALQGAPSPEELEAAQAANEADLQATAANLEAELVALKAKFSELNDQYLRGQAEVQNARRRADADVAKVRKFALEAFAESLLPVIDSLEAGLTHVDASAAQLLEGSEATLRQLKAALERNQVLQIDPAAGDKFDPHLHEAISVVQAAQEPNTIVSVLQKGYTISERVLRPALVTVSAAAG